MRISAALISMLSTSALLLSCSGSQNSPVQDVAWNQDGSITVVRPLPAIIQSESSPVLQGFLPNTKQRVETLTPITPKVELRLEQQTLTLKLTDGSQKAFAVRVGSNVSRGTQTIIHTQRAPLWHAPDQYFSKRNLPIPARGSRERMLRGALGPLALFLDADTAIHSGSVWAEEVGGVQMEIEALEQLSKHLSTGSSLEILQ